MPTCGAPADVFHLYPDGTNHVLHLRARVRQTVLFSQYEAVRVALKRPLKPAVTLIVVNRQHGTASWEATLMKANGRTRTVPLSVLVHRAEDVTEAATATVGGPSRVSAEEDDQTGTPSSSPCTTPTREQRAHWDATRTAVVTVKEVTVKPHVYSSTEQLLQQINEMVDVVHPNIVRVLTVATHNGFFPEHDNRRRLDAATRYCASGSLLCPAPTSGATFGTDPSVVVVEELCGITSVGQCLCGPGPPLATPSMKPRAGASPPTTGKRLNELQVAAVLHDALRALRYLHDTCRLCHRRVNTANLLIDSNHGKVVLRHSWEYTQPTDLIPPRAAHAAAGHTAKTSTVLLGVGESDSYAGDMWMLGLATLEMLMGETAADSPRVKRVAAKIGTMAALGNKTREATSPSSPPVVEQHREHRMQLSDFYPDAFRNLSDDLFDVLCRCLNEDPSHRDSAHTLLSHPFFAVARGQNVVDRSRVLGSIIALHAPSPPPHSDTTAGGVPAAAATASRVQPPRQLDRSTRGSPPRRHAHHRSTSTATSDDATSSLESSPSTVAAYRSVVRDNSSAKRRRQRDHGTAGGTDQQEMSTTPTMTETRDASAGAVGTTSTSETTHDGARATQGTASGEPAPQASPDSPRPSAVDENALRSLRAGFLRAMRGPSVVEAARASQPSQVQAITPGHLQHMLSSFPTPQRHRLGRRLRSASVASSIESVGLRSFPITVTLLEPATNATVDFLQTVSMVLLPLSTSELRQMESLEQWPYDMRRVRHYLRATGPTPRFEEIFTLLKALCTQLSQLHNTSPRLALLLIRTIATNYATLDRGTVPFVRRCLRLEEDVQRRLQQQPQRRARGAARSPSAAAGRGGSVYARSPLTSPALHRGGRDSPVPSSSPSRGDGSALPTLGEAMQWFAPDSITAGVTPLTFASAPPAFRGGDGEAASCVDRDQRGNAAFFLYDRWMQSPAGKAF